MFKRVSNQIKSSPWIWKGVSATLYKVADTPFHIQGDEKSVKLIKYSASTKHLYNIYTMLDQRRRRLAGVVQMLYKCFVFAGQFVVDEQLLIFNEGGYLFFTNINIFLSFEAGNFVSNSTF